MKVCTKCGGEFALEMFLWKGGSMRSYCRACEAQRKRESRARVKAEKLAVKTKHKCSKCGIELRNAPHGGRKPMCKDCGEDERRGKPTAICGSCGKPCWPSRAHDVPCCIACTTKARAANKIKKTPRLTDDDYADKRARQAAYDREVRVRQTLRGRDREPEQYMEFALGEFWHLDSKCRGNWGKRCTQGLNGKPKWIVGTGRCYVCATGRPRQHLRLAELRDREAS